jgi:hypothetical protein
LIVRFVAHVIKNAMSICDIQSGGYLCRDKTSEKIRNKYYWKGMFKDVSNFVKLYSMQRASVYQHKLIYNLLSNILEKRWHLR